MRFTAAALLLCTSTFAATPDSKRIDGEVRKITKAAILIDTHNDIPSFTVQGADIGNSPKNHTDIQRLREGGVGRSSFRSTLPQPM